MIGVLARHLCGLELEVKVMKSGGAGYFLGTSDGSVFVSRESEYFHSSYEAQKALDNNTFTQRTNP